MESFSSYACQMRVTPSSTHSQTHKERQKEKHNEKSVPTKTRKSWYIQNLCGAIAAAAAAAASWLSEIYGRICTFIVWNVGRAQSLVSYPCVCVYCKSSSHFHTSTVRVLMMIVVVSIHKRGIKGKSTQRIVQDDWTSNREREREKKRATYTQHPHSQLQYHDW